MHVIRIINYIPRVLGHVKETYGRIFCRACAAVDHSIFSQTMER
jgi:hypothetical protein